MYFVYIMTNRSTTLYIGVTNSLVRRVREHKTRTGSEFTTKYKLDRLVYFERFEDVHNAIEREVYQGLAANQENRPNRVNESFLEGLERGVVRAPSIPAAQRLSLRSSRNGKGRGVSAPPPSESNYAAGIIFCIRSFICSGDTSSTCVATPHRWPNGS